MANTRLNCILNLKKYLYNVLIWCSGSDPMVLELSPNSERIRHAGYGSLVLIPATVGLFSMSYAISTLTEIILIYLIAGSVWSIIILFVDRFIVSTFNKITNIRTFVFSLITRLALAIIVGIIIGHPVALLVLDSSINSQLEKKRTLEYSKYDKQISIIQTRYDSINASLLKEIDVLYEIKGKYVALFTAEQSGQKVYFPEIGYTSGQVGYKDRAKNYQNIITDYQNRIDKAETIYKAHTQENELLKKSSIDSIKSIAKRFDANFSRDYLSRALALKELQESDSQVLIIELSIILFFIFLDTIPIVFKSMTSPGVYEQIIADENKIVDGESPPGLFKYKITRQLENIKMESYFATEKQKIEGVKSQTDNKFNINNNRTTNSDVTIKIGDTESISNNIFESDGQKDSITGISETGDINKNISKSNSTKQTSNNPKTYQEKITKSRSFGINNIFLKYLLLLLAQGILIYILTKSITDVGRAALMLFALDFIIRSIKKNLTKETI